VFGNYPAAVVSATPESIDALTPNLLAKWHREHYAPQNAVLGIAGDVHAAELILSLKKWLGAWQKTNFKEELPPDPAPATTKKVYLVDRPNSVQTTITLGNIAIERRDPDYIPMVVMNRVVGGGPSSRLFINLREEKGYTYGVYSSFTALKYPGPWRASGDVRTEVTEGAMTEFLNEIRRIREERVALAELGESKRSAVAGFALSLEQPTQLLNYEITRKIYDFPADYWDTYPTMLMGVTADDVQRMARKYIDPGILQVVAVGDANKIKAVLEKYGPVAVYDTEGKQK
jgi:predicted Zn-dependent peptidase